MPFCEAGGEPGVDAAAHAGHAMATDHEGHGEMHHAVDPAEDGHDGVACNQCGLCHLACCPAVSGAATALTVSDVLHAVYQATPQHSVTSFQPDPFLRPPRRARA
jgi:hypothetical protein